MHNYNLGLIALSFVIAVFGSFTALQLAMRIPQSDKRGVGFWVVSAGMALGGGIWSMHFIGMLAMEMPFPMQFDISLTALSFIVAVVFVCFGLVIAGRDLLGDASLLIGGGIAGLGVSCMHYMGMYSMQVPATIEYNAMIVILSVVIGIVAATAALWLAFNLRGKWQRFGSAFIMGFAVCGMHYTGMYAAIMTPNDSIVVPSVGLSGNGLAGIVSVIALILFVSILFLNYLKTRPVQRLA